MKRILSIVLALVMAAGLLSVGALADGEPTIRVSGVEADPGDTITVEVSLENNPGIMAFVLGIEYDESRLEKVKYSHSGLQGLWAMSENAVWVGSEDNTYEGVFMKLKFRVLDDAPGGEAVVTITYTDGGICNYDEESIAFAVVSGGVTVSGEAGEAAPGETKAPEATEKPDATKSPEATEKPDATTAPESTERPDATEALTEDEEAPVSAEENEPASAAEAEPAEAANADVQASDITAEASFVAPVLNGDADGADGADGANRSTILLLILLLAVVAVVLIVIIVVSLAKKNSYHGRH